MIEKNIVNHIIRQYFNQERHDTSRKTFSSKFSNKTISNIPEKIDILNLDLPKDIETFKAISLACFKNLI